MCLRIYKLSEKTQHKVPKWELSDEDVWKQKQKQKQIFLFFPKPKYLPATSVKT